MLYTPVQVSQVERELLELITLYMDLAPRRVLEIGVHKGGTLFHWLTRAPFMAKVCGVDKGKENWYPPSPEFDTAIYNEWVPFGVEFEYIEGDSRAADTIQRVKDFLGEIDFMFIDGDHSYEGVSADWYNYTPLMAAGGMIALHDLKTPSFSPHIQVCRLWEEIKDSDAIWQEIDGGQEWGGIGLVFV